MRSDVLGHGETKYPLRYVRRRWDGVLLHNLFRLILGPLGSIFLIILGLLPNVAQADGRYGLWIEVEAEGRPQPFRTLREFEQLKDIISSEPFTDIYCQVYRGGRSWFPSLLADEEPFQRAQEFGVDPLRDVLEIAHARGIRVHAWLNALRIDQNRNAPILARLGPSIVLTDNSGHSLLDWNEKTRRFRSFELDTPGLWLDPSVLGVRHYLGALVKDLLRSYPDLDGIHLDMIRFPFSGGGGKPAFPYGSEARRRFFDEFRRFPPRAGFKPALTASNEIWESWKRRQVGGVVEAVRDAIRATAPGRELSAAVIAWPDRARNSAFQDWSQWLDEGTLDTAVIMDYTKDDRSFRTNLNHAVSGRSRGQVLAGVGAWLFVNTPQGLTRQMNIADEAGAHGVVLFSYANLAASKNAQRLFEFARRDWAATDTRSRVELHPSQSIAASPQADEFDPDAPTPSTGKAGEEKRSSPQ